MNILIIFMVEKRKNKQKTRSIAIQEKKIQEKKYICNTIIEINKQNIEMFLY